YAYAKELSGNLDGALLHPYDDEFVVAGQGTVADDLLLLRPDVTHLLVPVGGGGLKAGVLNRLQELGRDDIRVTAVQAPGSNSLGRSLLEAQNGKKNKKAEVFEAEAPNQLFGGSAVKFVGEHALQSALKY